MYVELDGWVVPRRAEGPNPGESLDGWTLNRCGTDAFEEGLHILHCLNHIAQRGQDIRARPGDAPLLRDLSVTPLSGICDALGCLRVSLPEVDPLLLAKFSLVVKTKQDEEFDKPDNQDLHLKLETTSRPSEASKTSESKGEPYVARYTTLPSLDILDDNSDTDKSRISIDELAKEIQDVTISMPETQKPNHDEHLLDLPVLVVGYKKQGDKTLLVKGTTQMRLYLTACVKFLDAVGIRDFIVYGMLTDGPHVTFPAAIMDERGVRFEYGFYILYAL